MKRRKRLLMKNSVACVLAIFAVLALEGFVRDGNPSNLLVQGTT